jgi:hypothetical protein
MASKQRKRPDAKDAGRQLRKSTPVDPGPKRQSITIRMDEELYEELQKLAVVRKTKVSYIIEDLVSGYLGM